MPISDFLSWLDFFNRYSNLVLVAVTTVYVVLTWGMVREMRRTRESELEPHLIASLEPMGSNYGMIRVQNIGGGPALNVEIVISVRPENESLRRTWRSPTAWPSQIDEFLMPSSSPSGQLPTLKQLESEYAEVCVDAKWHNLMGKNRSRSFNFDLHKQQEGWYHAGRLRKDFDVEDTLKEVRKALNSIGRSLAHIDGQVSTLANSSRSLIERHKADGEEQARPPDVDKETSSTTSPEAM